MLPAPGADLELLDPDSASSPGGPRWERLLGLLLVLGLVTAGLWQWRSQSSYQSAYRTARQAEAAQIWDSALAGYTQAGDYLDAPARAHTIAATIHERDTAFVTAAAALQGRDWATLIPAMASLNRLAPAAPATLRFAAALDAAVYTPALSGTLALRPVAQPPGWYTYHAGAWHWLAGSDLQSRIETRCPNGDWLIDVPLPPGGGSLSAPAPSAPPGADNFAADEGARLAGRRLALITPNGTTHTLLDPALNGWSYRWCDARQVWGFQESQRQPSDELPMVALTATRQLFDQALARPLQLPGPAWFVSGWPSANGQQLLVVDETGYQAQAPHTRVALAGTNDGSLRPLGEFPGALQSSSLSPDGRSLVLQLLDRVPVGPPPSQPGLRVSILLLDLVGQRPPATVAQLTIPGRGPLGSPPLLGGFLSQPPYRNWLFVQRHDGPADSLRLIPPGAITPTQTYTLPLNLYNSGDLFEGNGSGRLLLNASDSSPGSGGPSNTIVVLSPSGTVTAFQPPLAADQQLGVMMIRAGRLLYQVTPRYYGVRAPLPIAFYSVSLDDLGRTGVQPTTVYRGIFAAGDPSIDSWSFGQDWLTYLAPGGDLHARRYDGTGDLLLAHGITSVVPPSYGDYVGSWFP